MAGEGMTSPAIRVAADDGVRQSVYRDTYQGYIAELAILPYGLAFASAVATRQLSGKALVGVYYDHLKQLALALFITGDLASQMVNVHVLSMTHVWQTCKG